jgi:hypothetical protein
MCRTLRRLTSSQSSGKALSRQRFDLVRRPEVSIPESWWTLSRKVSNAASIGVCFCTTSEKLAFCISSVAALKRWLLTASIARKANACASGTPSAPVCRNSMCAFTFPNTVAKVTPVYFQTCVVPGDLGGIPSTAGIHGSLGCLWRGAMNAFSL